jgi:ribonuclease D
MNGINCTYTTSDFLRAAKEYWWVGHDNSCELVSQLRGAYTRGQPVGFDTEFEPVKHRYNAVPLLIQLAVPTESGLPVSWVLTPEMLPELKTWFEFAGALKVAHYAKVDVGSLENLGVKVAGWDCTMAQARRVWPNLEEYGLKELVGPMLGIELTSFKEASRGKTVASLIAERDPLFLEYSAMDPCLCVALYDKIRSAK